MLRLVVGPKREIENMVPALPSYIPSTCCVLEWSQGDQAEKGKGPALKKVKV